VFFGSDDDVIKHNNNILKLLDSPDSKIVFRLQKLRWNLTWSVTCVPDGQYLRPTDKQRRKKLLIMFCCIMSLIAMSISSIWVAGKFRLPRQVFKAKLIRQLEYEPTYFVKGCI